MSCINGIAEHDVFFSVIQCVPVYAIVVIFVMSRVIKRVRINSFFSKKTISLLFQIHHEKTVKLNAEVQIKDEAYFTYLKQQWSHSK